MQGPRFSASASRIEGRTADGWVVDGRLHRPALLVTAGRVECLGPLALDTLEGDLLADLDRADLLLLGSGATLRRPPRAFAEALRARGIRVEPMDSAAAARTFNVLVAEERLVAALLL